MKSKTLIIGSALIAAVTLSCGESKKLQEAREDILKSTPQYQTVMFGENHIVKEDNEYAAKFLPRLKEQGYDYFAIELSRDPKVPEFSDFVKNMINDYNNEDIDEDELIQLTGLLTNNDQKKLTIKLKSILKEYAEGNIERTDISRFWTWSTKYSTPGWFDLIDKARAQDMKMVCYDANDGEFTSHNQREEQAMQNVKELIFDKDPDAKVVFYVGSCHLSEKPTRHNGMIDYERLFLNRYSEGKFKNLGARLNEFTNGKNYTIDISGNEFVSEVNYTDVRINMLTGKVEKNISEKEPIR